MTSALFVDMAKWYGITPPISEDPPKEVDLVQTRTLTECQKSYSVFEELKHQYDMSLSISPLTECNLSFNVFCDSVSLDVVPLLKLLAGFVIS